MSSATRWLRDGSGKTQVPAPFTIRSEVLDWTLVLGRRHLDRILRRYERHYNEQRPHRGLDLAVPDGPVQLPTGLPERIERTDILGGLIHEYHAVAA